MERKLRRSDRSRHEKLSVECFEQPARKNFPAHHTTHPPKTSPINIRKRHAHERSELRRSAGAPPAPADQQLHNNLSHRQTMPYRRPSEASKRSEERRVGKECRSRWS